MYNMQYVLDSLQENTYIFTQNGRDEGEAVGEHGTLHHVELGKDHEDEQCQPDHVHGLEDPDDQQVGEGGAPAGFEDADPSRPDQCSCVIHVLSIIKA